MYFLGSNFLGGYNSVSYTPTNVDNISVVTLQNGLYDDLYISKEVSSAPTHIIPSDWDFDTILHATFDGNTNAGNSDWNTSTVTSIIVKRRKSDEFNWYTINTKEIHTIDDFTISGIDYMNAGNVTYEYAVVPVFHGIEGAYSTTSVFSRLNGIFLVEKDKIYGTAITKAFCDTNRKNPGSYIETIHSKYPTVIDVSCANYDTGNFEGSFVPIDDDCEYHIDENYDRVKFQRELIDFLSDRKPKILKHMDGRIWLVEIDHDSINDNADQIYYDRNITFTWTEIGNYLSEEDLYNMNLSDITEEWWIQ